MIDTREPMQVRYEGKTHPVTHFDRRGEGVLMRYWFDVVEEYGLFERGRPWTKARRDYPGIILENVPPEPEIWTIGRYYDGEPFIADHDTSPADNEKWTRLVNLILHPDGRIVTRKVIEAAND